MNENDQDRVSFVFDCDDPDATLIEGKERYDWARSADIPAACCTHQRDCRATGNT